MLQVTEKMESFRLCSRVFLLVSTGRLVASLVAEFLQFFNLDFTLAVFHPETSTVRKVILHLSCEISAEGILSWKSVSLTLHGCLHLGYFCLLDCFIVFLEAIWVALCNLKLLRKECSYRLILRCHPAAVRRGLKHSCSTKWPDFICCTASLNLEMSLSS